MKTVTIEATSKKQAVSKCRSIYNFTPAAAYPVDSGKEGVKAWICFEYYQDAEMWKGQK